jgi:hypothetical protein
MHTHHQPATPASPLPGVRLQITLPQWRQQRPALMVECAAVAPATPEQQAAAEQAAAAAGVAAGEATVLLRLTGYVRAAGLSASQAMTVPGAGQGAAAMAASVALHRPRSGGQGGCSVNLQLQRQAVQYPCLHIPASFRCDCCAAHTCIALLPCCPPAAQAWVTSPLPA